MMVVAAGPLPGRFETRSACVPFWALVVVVETVPNQLNQPLEFDSKSPLAMMFGPERRRGEGDRADAADAEVTVVLDEQRRASPSGCGAGGAPTDVADGAPAGCRR